MSLFNSILNVTSLMRRPNYQAVEAYQLAVRRASGHLLLFLDPQLASPTMP